MRYAVTDVQVPLDSVSQICDGGATVMFTATGGQIIGPDYSVDFERKGDTYVRSTWVKVPNGSKRQSSTMQSSPGKTAAEAYALEARRYG